MERFRVQGGFGGLMFWFVPSEVVVQCAVCSWARGYLGFRTSRRVARSSYRDSPRQKAFGDFGSSPAAGSVQQRF